MTVINDIMDRAKVYLTTGWLGGVGRGGTGSA